MKDTLYIIKEQIKKGKTETSINTFLDYSKDNAKEYLDELILISGDFNAVNQKNRLGIIREEEFTLKINKINYSLISIIRKIERENSVETNKNFKKIYLSKLPVTTNKFFGRKKELTQLKSNLLQEKINVISVIAWGGMGKSALINEFLNELSIEEFSGYDYVFGWSFYNQGISEKRQTSSDEFFNRLMDYLGLGHFSSKSNWEKTSILIEQVSKKNILIVLDGLEPLQFPSGELLGKIRDKNLSTFINELSRYNKGKILISSRLSVLDIKSSIGKTVFEIKLDNLTKDSGVELLTHLGVRGAKNEIEESINELKGHPLSLILLGNYLRVVFKGQIDNRKNMKSLYNERLTGETAQKIISTYKSWLEGKPEINLLNILGLFDRPINYKLFELFIKSSPIDFVSDQIQNLSRDEIYYLFNYLKELNLITIKEHEKDIEVDCHPIIREYFQNDIKKNQHDHWKKAHELLFDFYTNRPNKEFPDTFEELEPLFLSIYHGCQAKMYKEAFNVYWERIKRKHQHYSTANLGLFGLDLSMLSNFFEEKWSTPIDELHGTIKAYVFYWSGFSLTAIGFLKDSIAPLENALSSRISLKQWKSASSIADNIAETYIPLGELMEAKKFADLSLVYARKGKDEYLAENKLCSVGNILHLMGKNEEAEGYFKEAEKLVHKRKAKHKYLHLYNSYQYCCFLLNQEKNDEVIERTNETLRPEIGEHWTLDVALNKFCKGKALLKKAEIHSEYLSTANLIINEAVDDLKTAGMITYIAFGLLLRVQLEIKLKDYERARRTLEDVNEIIETNNLKLISVDYHSELASLELASNNFKEAKKNYEISNNAMIKMEYYSKKKELSILENRIRTATNNV